MSENRRDAYLRFLELFVRLLRSRLDSTPALLEKTANSTGSLLHLLHSLALLLLGLSGNGFGSSRNNRNTEANATVSSSSSTFSSTGAGAASSKPIKSVLDIVRVVLL